MLILGALFLRSLGRGAVVAEDGTIWNGMSDLATDVRLQEPRIDRAAVRRAEGLASAGKSTAENYAQPGPPIPAIRFVRPSWC
jgi:hypothetical protein